MAKTVVYSLNGEKVKDLELNSKVWDIEANEVVLTDAIKVQVNSERQGTAKVKTRAEVSGGGRKPWRQKGTGRARQGSIRSPQWRHGGIVFGPSPRSYEIKQNKKERTLALKSALSLKYQEKGLIVVENLNLETNKTKELAKTLETLKATGKTLIISNETVENVMLSARNNKNISYAALNEINVYDLVNNAFLVIDEASVKKLEEVLG